MKKKVLGFSLLELLVVLSIVAIFVSVVIVGLADSQQQSRDVKRKADLQLVANAVELYKNKYGHYPSGCNGSTTDLSTEWSGEEGTGYECSGNNNEYIVNLAPEFIPALPRDPNDGLASGIFEYGYVYTVNNEGSVYKFMALNSVESESVSQEDDFYRCVNSFTLGFDFTATGNPSTPVRSWEDPAMCFRQYQNPISNSTTHTFNHCTNSDLFEDDYAVSAGYSRDARGNTTFPERGREYDTEIVRCS